uniref:Immunoglobulin V-set domain-containing protein n=1 Tax=Amphiprion percula TaxID=161767 RepID=A0A3P8SPE7_AMPPE
WIVLIPVLSQSLWLQLLMKHCVNCQQLTAVKDEESSLEGSIVTLTYKYSKTIDANDYFFWYRQHPGKSPGFLIVSYGTKNAASAGLSVSVSEDKNQISMKISSAAVSDSAVYYSSHNQFLFYFSSDLKLNISLI